MTTSPILERFPLGLHWPTLDPFLFCAHHKDAYPRANGEMGPQASLQGRQLGQDFEGRDGWRMYHGQAVPGFPAHPHRGFETVTMVRSGLVDHADSLGAAGRYGAGDVQWMTAGRGVQHSEMFPLLSREEDNPLELFQVWVNLPARNKMAEPHFAMFWAPEVPVWTATNARGAETRIEVVAGCYEQVQALPPPPASWASSSEHDVQIWLVSLEPWASLTLPPVPAGHHRMLYVHAGNLLQLGEESLPSGQGVRLANDLPLQVENGEQPAALLLLQGKPIAEPVAQYGPFVMNRREELQQAFEDYQRTAFGGWPWPRHDQVHGERGRFARYADGREVVPE